MFTGIGEDLKKLLLAGLGAMSVTAEKSKEIVDELVKKGELTLEQGKVLNEELKRKIKENVNVTVINEKQDMNANAIMENLDKLSAEEIKAIKEKLDQLENNNANESTAE